MTRSCRHVLGPSWLAAAIVYGFVTLTPGNFTHGVEPNPFDDRWSLEYFVATKPGGETHRWTERASGQWHSDTISTDDAGQRSVSVQDTEPLLAANGTVTIADSAAGDEKTKTLKLTLKWSHGSGQMLTITSDKGTVSLPHKYLTTQWTLTPTSTLRVVPEPGMQKPLHNGHHTPCNDITPLAPAAARSPAAWHKCVQPAAIAWPRRTCPACEADEAWQPRACGH